MAKAEILIAEIEGYGDVEVLAFGNGKIRVGVCSRGGVDASLARRGGGARVEGVGCGKRGVSLCL